jgi:hypothetical protein
MHNTFNRFAQIGIKGAAIVAGVGIGAVSIIVGIQGAALALSDPEPAKSAGMAIMQLSAFGVAGGFEVARRIRSRLIRYNAPA